MSNKCGCFCCMGDNLEQNSRIIICKNKGNECGCWKHGECTRVLLLLSVKSQENGMHSRHLILFWGLQTLCSSPLGQNSYINQCLHILSLMDAAIPTSTRGQPMS
jgi:hypothetical protein